MSLKPIVCPNCGAPASPEPELKILKCGYCKHHFENPVYEKKTQSLFPDHHRRIAEIFPGYIWQP